MAEYLNITGRIRTTASDTNVVETQEVFDETKQQKQSTINSDFESRIAALHAQDYLYYDATSDDTSIATILPSTGTTGKIYRIANWNANATGIDQDTYYNTAYYSEYAWDANASTPAYTLLSVSASGITDIPAENDSRLITSRGVKSAINNVAFSTNEKVNTIGIDSEPTSGSNNLVKSGGVAKELTLGAVYDVSAKNPTAGPNNDGKWESLSALLLDANLNILIPTSVRKGGMSIKFVQSSDNKYVQYRLMKPAWSNNINDWYNETIETLGYQTSNTKDFILRTKGFYWDNDDNTHVTIHEAGSYCYLDPIPVKQGDKFYLKCKANYTSAWLVTDENDVVLEKAPAGEYYEGEITISAANAAKLYINLGYTAEVNNDNVIFIFDSYVYRIIKSLNANLAENIPQLYKNFGYDLLSETEEGYYYNNNGIITKNSSTSFRHLKIKVSNGDKFYLKTFFTTGQKIYIISDESGNVLSQGPSNQDWEGLVEITDVNAYWFYVNFKASELQNCGFINYTQLLSVGDSARTKANRLGYQTSCTKEFDIEKNGRWENYNNTGVAYFNYKQDFVGLKQIEVKNGDKFYLKTFNGSSVPYFITDADSNILITGSNSLTNFDGEVTINNVNAAFLLVNCHKNYINDLVLIFDSFLYQQSKRLEGIEETKVLAKETGYQTSNIKCFDFAYTNRFYWDNDDNVHVTTHEASSYACLKPIPIKKGDKFYLRCFPSATNAWIVTDDDDVVLEKAQIPQLTDWFDSEVEVSAENAAKLYINCGDKTKLSQMVFIFDSYVYRQIKNINEILTSEVESVRRLFPKPTYFDLLKTKCPHFYEHMKKKDKDVCVVLTGTSLTQGNKYTTEREDASERPPLLGTNDLASALFDKMINGWYGQKYRRYDHEDITYSDGTWETTNDLVVNNVHIWDDRLQFKNPWTKTTIDANAYVRFTIPDDAWQFNFIYKTDTTGGTCTVTIAEGNGKVEVWNGSTWIEANGYTFSMHEDEAQYSSESGLNTRGNTTYQKRLKMRCKNNTTGGINSIGETKVITISKGNDSSRLNVVGFEWSPREFMFTFINGARGSHQWGLENSNLTPPNLDLTNLEAWQDNDIWEFNPDLIISEVTLINYGASNENSANYRKRQFEYYVRRAFFNDAVKIAANGTETPEPDGRSLAIKSNSWQDCEIIFYGSLMMGNATNMYDNHGNFVAIKNSINGQLSKIVNNIAGDSYGDVKFASDNYDWVDNYMKTKNNFIYIPTLWEFIRVSYSHYGNYKAAFAASGADGNTLSFDGTHLNDNGAALWAALITPLFEF